MMSILVINNKEDWSGQEVWTDCLLTWTGPLIVEDVINSHQAEWFLAPVCSK